LLCTVRSPPIIRLANGFGVPPPELFSAPLLPPVLPRRPCDLVTLLPPKVIRALNIRDCGSFRRFSTQCQSVLFVFPLYDIVFFFPFHGEKDPYDLATPVIFCFFFPVFLFMRFSWLPFFWRGFPPVFFFCPILFGAALTARRGLYVKNSPLF